MTGPATPKRRRAPRLDPEVRRPLILDAALRVYLRDGQKGVSMAAIAAEAQVTKPVLYNSFPSKRELFDALLERERQEVFQAVADALPPDVEIDHPEQALSYGFRAYFRAVSARPESFRATLLFQDRLSPDANAAIVQARTFMRTQISALVEQWLTSVGAADPQRTATIAGHAIVGMSENLARLLLEEPGAWDPDELADFLTTLLTEGNRGLAG